jgi:predicted HTH transcriptional regulator
LKLLERHRAILSLLQQSPTLTIAALAAQVGISTRKTETNLAKLKAAGYLLRVGTTRSGHWQVRHFNAPPPDKH